MNIKNLIMGIAIIILTIFVTFYGINTFFPKPNYEDFCGRVSYDAPITDNATCVAQGGKWSYLTGPKTETQSDGYCDLYYYCSQEYDGLLRERGKKIFLLALPLGIIVIAIGAFVFGVEAVGAGLMGGGVGTLIYGSGAYWPYTQNWLRFLLSFIGLALLIWLSYFFEKKFRKRKKR